MLQFYHNLPLLIRVHHAARINVSRNAFLNWESTKHGPLVHGPPPWTGSMKIWTGPWTPFMDRVHGPPIFTTPTD